MEIATRRRAEIAGNPKNAPERKVGVGIIGAGAIARVHAAAYLAAAGRGSIVGIVDPDMARATRLQAQVGAVVAVEDYGELLCRTDVDVVSVCTPPATHASIVLAALAAGKHVLCEKPLATALDELDHIVAGVERASALTVAAVFQHRDDPAVRHAKTLLAAGSIGAIDRVRLCANASRDASYYETRGRWETDGGGALMSHGIHLLDLLLWLVGDVRRVRARAERRRHDIEVEDTVFAEATLADGGVAIFECSTCARTDLNEVEIVGSDGTLRLRQRPGVGRGWRLSVASSRPLTHRPSGVSRWPVPSRARLLHMGEEVIFRALRTGRVSARVGHGPHIQRFLDAVAGACPVPVSAPEAARSVELALAMYVSNETRHPVDLPLARG